MCMALGVATLDDLAAEIEELATPKMPAGMLDAVKMLPEAESAARPDAEDGQRRAVPGSRAQERRRWTTCRSCKCWPEDGGRYITLPLVFTKDPETGARNIGTYRMQVYDGRTTGMHWQRHKGGAQHHRVAERLGKRLAGRRCARARSRRSTYSATAPMPEGSRRADARRVPAARARRAREVRDRRPRGAGQRADRPGGLRRAWRAAARRSVRRSHRLLLAPGRLSGLPRDLHHAAPAPDLPDDRRRHPADGGLLPRQGERADFPAARSGRRFRRSSTWRSRPPASSTTSSWSRSTSAIPAMRARS